MAKGTVTDEISILRFFETGPIEKVEVVFNIVREKMRERLRGCDRGAGELPDRAGGARRRASRPTVEDSGGGTPSAA